MEDYYEYLDSNGVTTLYKLIKDDTVALIDSYSVTINGITTNLDNHVNNADIHTPIATIEGMIDTAVGSLNYATPDYVDTKVADLVNSSPETLDTLKELSDALGNDSNFATTVANQIGSKASKDDVYTKQETDTLLESKANSVHNHVVSDITDFPTIPTKTSQLINDSGFLTSSNGLITSVSWNDITNKPNFSDIAISGSYNDLVDTPIIPTKTSELTNDSGYITSVSWSAIKDKPNFSTVATSGSYNDLSNKPTIPNVYNKTLTIQKNGTNVATFTSNSNTDVTADITVPTKVSELSNDSGFITGISWDKVTNKPTLAPVATSGSYTDLSNTPTIPTKVSQLENDMGFGTGGDTSDCVHKTGNETINGSKTFSNQMYLGGGGTSYGIISAKDNNSTLRLFGGSSVVTGANLDLYGEGLESGKFSLRARTRDKVIGLDGKTDGTLTWNTKNIAIDDNVVHKTGTETIEGTKKFTDDVVRKYTAVDITTTPTSDMYANFNFTDKNDKTLAYIQYAQRTNGVDYIGLRVRDKNSTTWGVQLNTNKEFVPLGNNSYSLGSSSYKWKNIYATTFNGNLSGTIASSTTATTQATSDNSTKIATTAWVRTYVNSVVGSGSVGASISAYYSNATTLTAEGNSSSSSGSYPSDYSNYIDISPKVGTIYTGSQLFGTLNASASGSTYSYTPSGSTVYHTTAKATANFSGAFSASAKYLCTTANAVKFRAYVSQGTSSSMGSPSVVDNSSAKSIFIRVQ